MSFLEFMGGDSWSHGREEVSLQGICVITHRLPGWVSVGLGQREEENGHVRVLPAAGYGG